MTISKAAKWRPSFYDYLLASRKFAGTDLQFAMSKLTEFRYSLQNRSRKGDDQLLENLNVAIRKTKESRSILRSEKYFLSIQYRQPARLPAVRRSIRLKPEITLSTIAIALLGNKSVMWRSKTGITYPIRNLLWWTEIGDT